MSPSSNQLGIWTRCLLNRTKRALLRYQFPSLSQHSPISFVIATIGKRDDLLDEKVIPSIVQQGIERFEIVLAGSYAGRYAGEPFLRCVPVRRETPYFYKPFQIGVDESNYEWIVDMDDDMSLKPDWYTALVRGARTRADVYGFHLLNADNSDYGDLFDVYAVRKNSKRIDFRTYFGCYIARREIFACESYPAFMSGDRYHGSRTALRGFKRVLLSDVQVVHHGTQTQGSRPEKASLGCFERTKELQRRLGHLPATANPSYEQRRHYLDRWWAYAEKLEKRRKRIGILGWFGHENMGDELILNNMLHSFSRHEIRVYTDSPDKTSMLHRLEAAYHYDSLRRDLCSLDLLVVGGGGVLHDRYIHKTLPASVLEKGETPVLVYAAGIPFFEWCCQLDYFAEQCYVVGLRDRPCLDFFRDQYPNTPSLLLPDPGFLTPDLQRKKIEKRVVLNIRMLPESWTCGLPRDVNQILLRELRSLYEFLRDEGYDPVVFGVEPRDEEWIAEGGFRSSVLGFEAAMEEIANAELLVGTRYHAGIVAATQGTPSILINYQQKMAGLTSLLSTGLTIVDIKDLELVRAFKMIGAEGQNSVQAAEVDALRQQIAAFNAAYIHGGGSHGDTKTNEGRQCSLEQEFEEIRK